MNKPQIIYIASIPHFYFSKTKTSIVCYYIVNRITKHALYNDFSLREEEHLIEDFNA